MASSRAAASVPLLLAALSRAEAATGELTTRGASALSALRLAVAAVSGTALSAKASNSSNANAAAAAANAGADAAASLPPSLTEEEVQAVWDAALKLWVRISSWNNRKRASQLGCRRRHRCLRLFFSLSLSLSFLLSSTFLYTSLSPSQRTQNTCVDACNGLQPPAWHVDARQLAW